jgi:hypothetical protein
VRVVGVVVGVVVLDEQVGPLDPVVVAASAGHGGALPREVERVDVDRDGQVVGQAVDVHLEQAPQPVLGFLVEFGAGHAERRDRHTGARPGSTVDVGRRRLGDHRRGARGWVERVEQREAEVLLGREWPDDRRAVVARRVGVGAEEHRRREHGVAVQRHRDRQVVALEPPAPALVVGGVAEDDHPVVLAVPAPAIALGPVEHLFEPDDRHRLRERVRPQRGGQQPVRGFAGAEVEVGEGRAGPAPRPVFHPAAHRVVVERRPRRFGCPGEQRGRLGTHRVRGTCHAYVSTLPPGRHQRLGNRPSNAPRTCPIR